MNLRSPAALWALLIVQGFCTLFFVFDAGLDAIGMENAPFARGTQLFEYVMSFTLVAGLILTVLALRNVSAAQVRLARQIQVASGAFEEVLEAHFREWGLTLAEQDVARLAIKGLSVAEMAHLRGSKEGTIKAQSAAVYRKANVTGRLQLISLFIEELMAEPPLDGAHVSGQ